MLGRKGEIHLERNEGTMGAPTGKCVPIFKLPFTL